MLKLVELKNGKTKQIYLQQYTIARLCKGPRTITAIGIVDSATTSKIINRISHLLVKEK